MHQRQVAACFFAAAEQGAEQGTAWTAAEQGTALVTRPNVVQGMRNQGNLVQELAMIATLQQPRQHVTHIMPTSNTNNMQVHLPVLASMGAVMHVREP